MWILTHVFFFRGDLSANECSSDISNWFECLRTSDSREIYVCMCFGKFSEDPDLVYVPEWIEI